MTSEGRPGRTTPASPRRSEPHQRRAGRVRDRVHSARAGPRAGRAVRRGGRPEVRTCRAQYLVPLHGRGEPVAGRPRPDGRSSRRAGPANARARETAYFIAFTWRLAFASANELERVRVGRPLPGRGRAGSSPAPPDSYRLIPPQAGLVTRRRNNGLGMADRAGGGAPLGGPQFGWALPNWVTALTYQPWTLLPSSPLSPNTTNRCTFDAQFARILMWPPSVFGRGRPTLARRHQPPRDL